MQILLTYDKWHKNYFSLEKVKKTLVFSDCNFYEKRFRNFLNITFGYESHYQFLTYSWEHFEGFDWKKVRSKSEGIFVKKVKKQ